MDGPICAGKLGWMVACVIGGTSPLPLTNMALGDTAVGCPNGAASAYVATCEPSGSPPPANKGKPAANVVGVAPPPPDSDRDLAAAWQCGVLLGSWLGHGLLGERDDQKHPFCGRVLKLPFQGWPGEEK